MYAWISNISQNLAIDAEIGKAGIIMNAKGDNIAVEHEELLTNINQTFLIQHSMNIILQAEFVTETGRNENNLLSKKIS